MKNPKTPTKNLHEDTRGASTVEYLVLLALVAFVGLAIWGAFTGPLGGATQRAGQAVDRIQFDGSGGGGP
jgi:Flp pilus assembly pilin Flp